MNDYLKSCFSRLTLHFFFFVFLLLISPSQAQAGFGISPAIIQEQHLVPGATVSRTLYLVQGNPEFDLPVNFIIDSNGISDWITVENLDENGLAVIPSGVQQFPVDITIRVPANANEDIYRLFIRAESVPPNSSEGQIAIALAGKLAVELTVGEDIFEGFEIGTVQLKDIPENGNPKVNATIKNVGNVPSGPDDVTYELFNKFGDVRLGYAQLNLSEDEVPAFTEETRTLEFPLDITIGVGEYWGHIKFYDERVLVREEKSVFRVRDDIVEEAEGIAAKSGGPRDGQNAQLLSSITGSESLIIVFGAIGSAVLVVLLLLVFRRRKD